MSEGAYHVCSICWKIYLNVLIDYWLLQSLMHAGAAEIRAKKVTEAHKHQLIGDESETSQSQLTYAKSAAEYKALIKGVFTNPTFWMLTLFLSCLHFFIAGFSAFGPKYFEYGFSMSPSLAGVMFGNIMVTIREFGLLCSI